MCEYIDKHSVTSMPLLDQLVYQRWSCFLTIDMCCHLINRVTSLENDVMDKTHLLAQHVDRSVLLLLLSSCQIHIPSTMILCNSRIPKLYLVCDQTSQRNWVIIKMLYSCLAMVFVELTQIEIRICHSVYRRGIYGPSR